MAYGERILNDEIISGFFDKDGVFIDKQNVDEKKFNKLTIQVIGWKEKFKNTLSEILVAQENYEFEVVKITFSPNGFLTIQEKNLKTIFLGFNPNLIIDKKKLLLNSKKSKSLEVLRSPFKLVQAPEIEIGIAWRSKTRSISFSQSLNKISGDIICPYPPGIPLIIPGEKIDLDRFNWINNKSLCNKDLVNFNIRVIET